KLAEVIVGYSTGVKKGDLVAVRGDPVAMPLIVATFEKVLKAGGHPFYLPESEELLDVFMAHASDEQLSYLSPIDMHRIEVIDVAIAFWAETNTKHMGKVDPSKPARRAASRQPYMSRFMERAATKNLRWCGTAYPTHGAAQDAEMNLEQFADFVFRAGLLHLPDPAAAWRVI